MMISGKKEEQVEVKIHCHEKTLPWWQKEGEHFLKFITWPIDEVYYALFVHLKYFIGIQQSSHSDFFCPTNFQVSRTRTRKI